MDIAVIQVTLERKEDFMTIKRNLHFNQLFKGKKNHFSAPLLWHYNLRIERVLSGKAIRVRFGSAQREHLGGIFL